MQIKQLSVVIPVFNEEANVESLVTEIDRVLTHKLDFEIVVVDDGSTDNTKQKLEQLKQTNPFLYTLHHRRNFGQSAGVYSGVTAATKPWIVTLDGDGQNDPNDILKLVRAAEDNFTPNKTLLIAGHRTKRRDNYGKKIASKMANAIRRYFLRDDCPDSGCGIKLFQRDAFLALPHFNHMHRFLPALFKRAGGLTINVPVNHRPRTQGTSKYTNFKRLKVGIADLLGVAWLIRRPCSPEIIKNDF